MNPDGVVILGDELLELVQKIVDEKWAPLGKGGKVARIEVRRQIHGGPALVLYPIEEPGVFLVAKTDAAP